MDAALENEWWLTPERIAVHSPTATAVVADLHLGYDAARRKSGDAIPLRNLADQLQPLLQACTRREASRLVLAGDCFEQAYDPALAEELEQWLRTHGLELLAVIPGNHDRRLHESSWPLFPEGYRLDRWLIVHGDGELPEGPAVYGHFHPCIRWQGRKQPCYLFHNQQLLLPAYSRDAAGVDVRQTPRWRTAACWRIHGERVVRCPEKNLGKFA